MGNLISVMSHCWGRGLEVILGDKSHIHIYEQGGIAQVRNLIHYAVFLENFNLSITQS